MKKVNIFIASSAELHEDKQMFDLYFSEKNKLLRPQDIDLDQRTWMDFSSSLNTERLQDRYNEYIRKCDIVVFLFHTRLGKYTKEELEVAYNAFLKNKGKGPRIFIYFKEEGIEDEALKDFKKYCEANLGHFCDTYTDHQDLRIKFDKQLQAAGELSEDASEDEFKFSDLGNIFKSKMFWLVALMCVLYYSAIFPFQKFAPDFLAKTLDVDSDTGAQLFSCFPILAMCLTPFLGGFIDRKGKAASMLMFGSLIMIACHLCFAFLLPAVPSQGLAIAIIAILGVSFSLVPAALWPSVPKIIDNRILGSAYCVIFWIQNIGLLIVPIVIGAVNDATGSYVAPMIIFSSFGVAALFIGMLLKLEDKKKGYGLELPNIKE